jgi:hypothetical protein
MRKTTIHPASAEDEMRRQYRREVRRHRLQRQRFTSNLMLVLGLLAVVTVFSVLTLKRHEQLSLPKTQFEVAAEQAAKAKAAKPSTPGLAASAKRTAEKPAAKKASAKKPSAPKLASKSASSTKTPATKLRLVTASAANVRVVHLGVSATGYVPAEVTVPLGTSIVLDVAPATTPGTAGFAIPALAVESDNSSSAVTIHLGAPGAGEYQYRSGSGAISGKLVVR